MFKTTCAIVLALIAWSILKGLYNSRWLITYKTKMHGYKGER